jgi:hypothetical protein
VEFSTKSLEPAVNKIAAFGQSVAQVTKPYRTAMCVTAGAGLLISGIFSWSNKEEDRKAVRQTIEEIVDSAQNIQLKADPVQGIASDSFNIKVPTEQFLKWDNVLSKSRDDLDGQGYLSTIGRDLQTENPGMMEYKISANSLDTKYNINNPNAKNTYGVVEELKDIMQSPKKFDIIAP